MVFPKGMCSHLISLFHVNKQLSEVKSFQSVRLFCLYQSVIHGLPLIDALVSRPMGRLKYFLFPFSSVLLIIVGSNALKAVAVVLSAGVAKKVPEPILILILLFIDALLSILLF